MKKHNYGIITRTAMGSTASGNRPETLDEALRQALAGSNYDEPGCGFKIDHMERVAEVRIEGRYMDGGQGIKTATTTDIGRDGVESCVRALLSHFEKVRSIEAKIISRDVDLNP